MLPAPPALLASMPFEELMMMLALILLLVEFFTVIPLPLFEIVLLDI